MIHVGNRSLKLLPLAMLSLSAACVQGTPNQAGEAPAANAATDSVPALRRAETTGRCPPPLSWGVLRGPGGPPALDPVRNKLSIDAHGYLYWNGFAIDRSTLRQYLDVTAQMTPAPLFELEVDPRAPCAETTDVIAMASMALDCGRNCSFARREVDSRRMRPVPPSPEVGNHSDAAADAVANAAASDLENAARAVQDQAVRMR